MKMKNKVQFRSSKLQLPLAGLLAALLGLMPATTFADTHYVFQNADKPQWPYKTWKTAAAVIQDAVNAASAGDEVLVDDGVYPGGVKVTNALALRSVNGPQVTLIDAARVHRCISLGDGASLTGFTLTNGQPAFIDSVWNGGGALCTGQAFLTNCMISKNSVRGAWRFVIILGRTNLVYESGHGGGVWGGTLYNCTLTGNSAGNGFGGGVYGATLYNCTLSGNHGGRGGGSFYGALYNCILHSNTATNGPNYSSVLNYCCTTPMPANGFGNITNDPAFVNEPAGDFRLQPNSPCINAGNNTCATNSTDLDGNPRIIGGTVDIGAYESQSPALLGCFTWLQSYGLPTDAATVYADSDGDGMNNWQEWRCHTNPTNPASVLRLLSSLPLGTSVTVTWQSVAGINYFLECSTDLTASPCFTPLASNCLGQAGTTAYTHTNGAGQPLLFYRVGVGN